jgi:hypothetical protein
MQLLMQSFASAYQAVERPGTQYHDDDDDDDDDNNLKHE